MIDEWLNFITAVVVRRISLWDCIVLIIMQQLRDISESVECHYIGNLVNSCTILPVHPSAW